MKNELLEEILKLKNRKDIDTFVENEIIKIKEKKVNYPLSHYLEAMHLYNMYLTAMDFKDVEGYLYPYKLRKCIEIKNSVESNLQFQKSNSLYVYRGEIKIVELNDVLGVLIKYANVGLIVKIMKAVMPMITKLTPLENVYVSLGLLKHLNIEIPPRIGQYFTADYLSECASMDFYQCARIKLKRIISLSQLPKKACAMFYQLPSLYKSLQNNGIFDFGVIALQCFKIIEVSTKEILQEGLSDFTNEQIYSFLPDDLKDNYQAEKFRLDRLEIGKIYHLLNNVNDLTDEFSSKIKSIFKDKETLDCYLSFITPFNVNKYRNGPAHGEYIAQEVADEALKLLENFIFEALYKVNKNRL